MLHALYSIPLALSLLLGGAQVTLADGGCFEPVMARASGSTKAAHPSTKSKKAKPAKKSKKTKKVAKPIQPPKKGTKKGHKTTKKSTTKPVTPRPDGNNNSESNPGR